jgi:hypothetical protein
MTDDSRRDQLRGRIDDGTDDARRAQRGDQFASGIDAFHRAPFVLAAVAVEIPEGNSVLHGDDGGVLRQQRRQLPEQRAQLVCLERKDHAILCSRLGRAVGGADRSEDLRAVLPDQLHAAVAAHGFQVGASHDHRDLVPDMGQARGDHAADGAGADDADLHGSFT